MACGLLLAMAWRQGGYFPDAHLQAGSAAFGTLAVLLAVRPPHFALSTSALLGLAALAGLVVWTGLSAHWSSAPDAALEAFGLGLVHLGVLGLGLMAAGSGRYSRHLVWAALGVIAVIVVAGLVSRLYPGTLDPRGTLSRFGGYRLAYPLGYWNAFGAIGAMGVVLAAGLAADRMSPVALRALAAGLTVPLGTAAYLSFSRGAWLAFFAGVAVLILVAAHRVSVAVTLSICGVALLAAVGRLAGYDALTERPGAGAGVYVEGAAYGPFLLAVALLAGLAQALASGRWVPAHARAQLGRAGRRAGLALAVVAVLAAAGVYALRAGDVEGETAARIESAEAWLDEQWDEFNTPAAVGDVSGTERLTTARGTRSDLYRVAIDGFEANPLLGDGAGGFEHRFAFDREVGEKVRDAHSLYLETLGELGIVGLALLLAFVGSAIRAAAIARARTDALSSGQSTAATAALAVWIAHAGVDWDWQVPALTGAALLLAASLYPGGRRGRRRARKPANGSGELATVGSRDRRYGPIVAESSP